MPAWKELEVGDGIRPPQDLDKESQGWSRAEGWTLGFCGSFNLRIIYMTSGLPLQKKKKKIVWKDR